MIELDNQRLPNGANGDRDTCGRFVRGCRPGPGNPRARQSENLRAALLEAVTPDDIRRIARKLVELAIGGDIPAIKLLFDRTMGPVTERLELAGEPVGRSIVTIPGKRERLGETAEVP